MARLVSIHPDNPQARLIEQVVDCVNQGGVIVYPTDSSYAVGCNLGDKEAMDRIRRLRGLDERHHFTLLCRDLSEIATYAVVDNTAYRLLRAFTPGPYTFVLPATRQVPRRLQHPKRKTIGLRVPDNKIAQALLEGLDKPLMSATLLMPGDDLPLTDPYDMEVTIGVQVDMIVDGGYCGYEMTTVVDLTTGVPEVMRVGKGDPNVFYVQAG